ncbi:MAG TPA: hypothetical protein PLI11_04710 [Clostridia bacterium]|nr:hypothetical protein [Clostridia bacterium]HPZ52198.1 hypothetical protein [Clostridia bacterium]
MSIPIPKSPSAKTDSTIESLIGKYGQRITDFLSRDGAPLSAELKKILTVRKFINIYGPLGTGV